jgi:DNA-binding XRE family transcriptional regulator
MIANLREHRISKTQAARFQAALQAFDQNPPAGDSILVQAQRDSLTSQLEDLLEEITAFEALHDSKRTSLNLSDLEILPQRLIQARIALGLTQKALADELGVSAQQVQRDEASEYQNASFSRMLEIARVLERYGNDLVLQPA